MEFLYFIVVWIIPILLVVYLYRTLGVIVDGLRALNASSLRIATAVEKLAAAKDGPGPPT